MKRLSPLSLSLLYLAFGSLWIAASDLVLEAIVPEAGLLSFFQTIKGWFFIVITGVMLFLLTRRLVADVVLAEEEKHLQEQFFRANFELGLIGMAIASPEKNWLHVNDQLCKILGFSKEELAGTTWDRLTHPDDLESDRENHRLLLAGESDRYDLEKRIIQKNGAIIVTHFFVTCVRRPDRAVEYVIAHVQDISGRKRAAKALYESEQRFRLIADSMPQLVWTAGPDGTLDFFNARFKEYTGSIPATDQAYAQPLHPDDEERTITVWRQALGTGAPYLLEHRVRHADGTYRWYLSRGIPVRDATSERIIKWYGSATDVDQFRQTEDELRRLTAELEDRVRERTTELRKRISEVELLNSAMINLADDLKEKNDDLERLSRQLAAANSELKDFAYIVSHDLKAPLRAVSQLSFWLAQDYRDKLDDDGREKIDLLISRVKRMDRLIDGILAYSRIGRLREKKEKIDLNVLVRNIIQSLGPSDTIRIDVQENLPTITGEHIRLEQIFQNLLNNALKFMDRPAGTIKIGCTDEHTCWKFWVIDNGPGIDPRYHEKIFQIFQTLAPRDERESTGIGLTLVKKIVETLGGTIWLESETGKGSAFFFTLPKKGNQHETAVQHSSD